MDLPKTTQLALCLQPTAKTEALLDVAHVSVTQSHGAEPTLFWGCGH